MALLLIVISLTGVVWLGTVLKQLQLVTSKGQDAVVFLQITMLALPSLMILIAPIALLIAVIHVLNKASTDSELIVMSAAGATSWRLGRPMIVLGVLISLIVLVMNFAVSPWSMRTLKEFVTKVRTDLISQVLRPGAFSSPEAGLTFHIRGRERNGDITGLLLHDTRDKKQALSYIAERGRIMKEDAGAYMLMFNGHILRRDLTEVSGRAPQNGAQIIEFQSYIVDLSSLGPKTAGGDLKPREMYFHELLDPPKDNRRFKANPGLFQAEFHERLANPLYPLLFVLIAIARLGKVQTTRESRVRSIVEAFLIAAAFRLGGLVSNNLVALTPVGVPLMYAVPLLGIALAIWTIQWRMAPRRRGRFARWFDVMLERLTPRTEGEVAR